MQHLDIHHVLECLHAGEHDELGAALVEVFAEALETNDDPVSILTGGVAWSVAVKRYKQGVLAGALIEMRQVLETDHAVSIHASCYPEELDPSTHAIMNRARARGARFPVSISTAKQILTKVKNERDEC